MLKVIIADDERLICRLVQTLADWDSLGMEVVAMAENGLEALELVQSRHPDILITDIRMPGCDGLELIRSAKQIMPDLEVVIISGYAHFEYAQSAMKYGAGYYLLKPIKQAELMETLEKSGKNVNPGWRQWNHQQAASEQPKGFKPHTGESGKGFDNESHRIDGGSSEGHLPCGDIRRHVPGVHGKN